jgi:Domain of unknown function (DUF4375)
MRLFLLGSVALLLAGCGGESGSGSPESPPAETRTGPAPDPGLLITRPRARGYDLLLEITTAMEERMGPEDREERWTALDGLSDEQLEKLSALDDRWFALDRELERRMLAYVEANPEEFFR